MSDIFNMLINKKPKETIYTGQVTALSPLTVKLYTDDNGIVCKSISSLFGLKVGSCVIMIKIGTQFVVIGVIGSISNIVYIKKDEDETRYNTTTTSADSDLTYAFTIPGTYEIEANLFITYDSDPGIGIRCRWVSNGGVSQKTKRHTIGVSHTEWHATQWVADDLSTEKAFGGNSNYVYSAQEKFLVTVASNGTLTLYWAQWTAETLDTRLKADSYMKITKLD